METFLKHLEDQIIINDLLIKKMKYEVQVLFHESSKKTQASFLAKKINTQLDTALIGLHDEDKTNVRKSLIKNSFLMVPNPKDENINYHHVFTTLTDYDQTTEESYLRLNHWLNLNTELSVDAQVLETYINTHKIKQDDSLSKRLHTKHTLVAPPVFKEKKAPLYLKFKWVIPLVIIFGVLFFDYFSSIEKPVSVDPPTFKEAASSENLVNINTSKASVFTSYTYEPLDYVTVYDYLKHKKESLLTTENFLSTIDRLAKAYDTDPLLLIAIIGHEQNFVPESHNDAALMINNPYNVFGSWLAYNTSFKDSTTICLNTIETSKSTQPEATDLIEHLNVTYAEDPEWHKGVKTIYKTLKNLK